MKSHQRDLSLPHVAVIVLNYKGWRDTIKCLASLQRLDYLSYDILVVDNHSQDDSVDRIARKFPDIEILQTDHNYGFAGGNNRGIRHLASRDFEYVWLLNNDTVVAPDSLSAMMAVATANPQAGAIGSVLTSMDDPDQVVSWGGGRLYLSIGHQRQAVAASSRIDYLTAASVLLRSQALSEVGLLDEAFFFLWEDVDLCLRLRSRGWDLKVAADSRVQHKEGGTSNAYSKFRMREHGKGLVILLRRYALLPWLSAIPILFYYSFVAVKTRRAELLGSALRGWLSGWQLPVKRTSKPVNNHTT